MRKKTLLVLLFSLPFFGWPQEYSSVSFKEWLSLEQASTPVISADGKYVAFTLNKANWKDNRYDSEIWLSEAGMPAYRLTRSPNGKSLNGQFSPDGKWFSFLADRGEKSQLYLISTTGGEALQLTHEPEGIDNYSWSPDGQKIAFIETETDQKKENQLSADYGDFEVEDNINRQLQAWLLRLNADTLALSAHYIYPAETPQKISSGDYSVTSIHWSPDSRRIALTIQPDRRAKSSLRSDIMLAELSDKTTTTLVNNPGTDTFEKWSPDGRQFIYSSSLSDTTSSYYKNNHLLIYNLANHSARELAAGFDEIKHIVDWNPEGIFFLALKKTRTLLYYLDPAKNQITARTKLPEIVSEACFSRNGRVMAFIGRNYDGLNELFISQKDGSAQQLTHFSNQISHWNIPQNEVISWKSKDGTLIEGVLLKPADYHPEKKYPLLVLIHGGPAGNDSPEPAPEYVYPIMQWVEKGAIVLRINYRGSAGYGQKFRSLNVRNLGRGDAWDVLSGIDYLNKKGLIDTSRMGCMGWSEGGYISAYLTATTHCFKAVSVGAGISDWITYYAGTDLTGFIPQYLRATPWDDPGIYKMTSPIANISRASTPTLIQHGELDKRVPLLNAYELYRALQDKHVPSRLIIYKRLGHGISRPRERLAAVRHNWQWFNYYVFGDTDLGDPNNLPANE